MHQEVEDGVQKRIITLRSKDGSISCGGRFQYLPEEIGPTYKDLVKALNDAIDKEAETKGEEFVTDTAEIHIAEELNFDDLMDEFNDVIGNLKRSYPDEEEFGERIAPRIQQIVERYLGRGKKVSQCTREQVEMLSLIVADLREL